MTDQLQWVHASSFKKVPYQVGIKKGEHLTSPRKGDDLQIELAAKSTAHGDSVHVDWPVGDKTWKAPAREVQELGISRYKLYELPLPAARRQPPQGMLEAEGYVPPTYYMLEFTTTTGNTFSFHMQNGDLYDYFAFSDSDHAIRYRAVPGGERIIGVI
ncbi:hypothetical protein HYPSUDRAFT_574762 [Hypholoma sublateritium FD-334 SS-4]|uniref:Uncharacterized protein n=1 Tax=Hypholoma sublateritium (strain FD-334 SS-4) TaxID=945553 RepID=A0A0D2MJE4_HYPSF|nr:hypothetical protein HYPSUDRAFT_574762 [Hypholoma sublateritium FD-334 SS-4]